MTDEQPHSPAVEAAHLLFRYPDGTPALRGADLTIAAGERVCIAGGNGAGKSTLLLALAGLIAPGGSLRVAGRAPRPDPTTFGLVFADADDQLFCPTLGEDIAFGPRAMRLPEDTARARAARCLEAVGLEGFEGRCAHHLSGGEKKRAAIAAVLACEPAILALDEPWANLDSRAARAVSAVLNGHAGTLIVSTHELRRAAPLCTRLVVLEAGRKAADLPMREAAASPALLEAFGLEL